MNEPSILSRKEALVLCKPGAASSFRPRVPARDDFARQGTRGNVCRQWVSKLGGGVCAAVILCVEDRDAAEYPTMHRATPATKDYLPKMSVGPGLRNPASDA